MMEQYLPVISLVLLITAIFLGFWRKMNMGVIAIAFSLVIGRMAGISDSKVLSGFGLALFLRLLGIMLLLAIVQGNGTVEKITRKVVALSGRALKLLPIIMYALFWGASAVGAGGPAGLALATVVSVPIAFQLGISPIMLAPAACWGTFAGVTTLGITGIVLKTVAGDANIPINMFLFCVTATIMQTIPLIIWYILSGWPKMKLNHDVNYEKTEPLNKANWISIAGLILMVFLSLVIQIDIGLAAFVCSFLLILIPGVIDERKAFGNISWGTLVMIGGMGMLINMVQQVGGIDMLSNLLSKLMTQRTAPAIVSIMSSLLSLVSSTTGVVMPTLIPTMPNIVESLGGSAVALSYAVTLGASQTAISPLSTGGALILAAYGNFYNPTPEQRSKLFVQLLLLALFMGVAFALLGFLSFYGLFLN